MPRTPARTSSRPVLPRIAVLGSAGVGYSRELALGIRQAARQQPRWSIRLYEMSAEEIGRVMRLRPDAVVAHLSSMAQYEFLSRHNVPLINCSGWLDLPDVPRVGIDDTAVGRMAADHLLERGFTRLAAVGLTSARFARRRCAAFEHAVRAAGHDPLPPPVQLFAQWESDAKAAARQQATFAKWIDQAGGPVGLFVTSDVLAVRYLDACLQLGVRVPDDVAVLGVDDEEVVCEMTDPPLSSVRVPTEQIGRRIADMLADLFAGGELPREPVLIKPLGVRVRQSTDVLAINDPQVVRAIEFVRTNASDPITVTQVVNATTLSRRMLEIRFRQHLKRSIYDEIQRCRLDRACELLIYTDRSVLDVALDCGYRTAQRLNEVFRRMLDTTPTAYRRSHRV